MNLPVIVKRNFIIFTFILSMTHAGNSMEEEKPLSTSRLSSWTQWTTIPYHFVATLFEPFFDENVQNFCRDQVSQVQDTGLMTYTSDKVKRGAIAIINYPFDTVSLCLGMGLSWTNVAEISPVVPAITQALNCWKNSKTLYSIGSSINGKDVVSKTIKLGIYGGGIYALASLPVASALHWDSLIDAKQHYSGGPCNDENVLQLMRPIIFCLTNGNSLNQCITGTSWNDKDLYTFTRHISSDPTIDPVSIVRWEGSQTTDQQTCFYSSLTPSSPVTKTCFPDLANPEDRIVEKVEDWSLTKAHLGLNPGETVQHVGVHTIDKSCGYFSEPALSKNNLGDNPICLLTALTRGGPVTQLCYNPDNPGELTLKRNDEFTLDFDDRDGKPVSLIIKNPEKLGLDIKPEVKTDTNPDTTSLSDNKGSIICEEGKCYRYEKVEVPCNMKD